MVICHIISGDLWAGAEVMCHRLIKGLQENKKIQVPQASCSEERGSSWLDNS